MFIRSEETGRLINLDYAEQILIQDDAVIAQMHMSDRRTCLSEVTLLKSEDPTLLETYLHDLERTICAAV